MHHGSAVPLLTRLVVKSFEFLITAKLSMKVKMECGSRSSRCGCGMNYEHYYYGRISTGALLGRRVNNNANANANRLFSGN
jgi:hypothetical protein